MVTRRSDRLVMLVFEAQPVNAGVLTLPRLGTLRVLGNRRRAAYAVLRKQVPSEVRAAWHGIELTKPRFPLRR